jgi:GNAT superfamily N-acetyltransferase
MPSLPILKSSSAVSPDQLIRLFHQSQLEWSRHVGEETELDFGRGISNPLLPASKDANCVLDAFCLPGEQAAESLKQLREHLRTFASLRCVLNPSMNRDQVPMLRDLLSADGWLEDPLDILHVQPGSLSSSSVAEDIRIIPARASFRHYHQLMEQRNPSSADEALLHLDDSHFDVLLALKQGVGIGSIGVLTSGETGTVREWFVLPEHRGKGIGQALFDRALEIAVRGLVRHLMIGLATDFDVASHLCRKRGFDKKGQWASFSKDSCKTA